MKCTFFLFFLLITLIRIPSQKQEFSIWEKKSILSLYHNEIELFKSLDSLTQLGFYALKIDSIQENSISKKYFITKGKFYNKLSITLDSLAKKTIKKDVIQTSNIDSILQLINNFYTQKGYSFNRVNFSKKKLGYFIDVFLGDKRKIDKFEIEGFKKIPRGLKENLNAQFLQRIYTDNKLLDISNFIKSQAFLQEIKPPQVLFTKDSTKIYLYLKKNKSSSFDGILGFGNDKNLDFKITGNIKLELGNIFNSFEKISLHWYSTPETSQNLTLGVEIPYVFKTKIGSKTQLNIYKQDSTFVRLKLNQNFYYRLTPNQKLGIHGLVESSNFLKSAFAMGNDYKKTGIGLNYEYVNPLNKSIVGNESEYFIQTTYLNSTIKNYKSLDQYFLQGMTQKTFSFKEKHYVQGKIEGLILLSDSLLTNELYRIGGVQSLRGFNEQSIAVNSYLIATLEYKYAPTHEFYLNAFTDFAWVENKIINETQNLLGVGFGIGFLSKFGLFTLQYAMGKFSNTTFNFNDSKIHIGVKSEF